MDEKTVALLSAGVAILAAAASGYFSLRSLRAQTLANRLSAANVKAQYFAELRAWADETCNALSDAVHLCRLDPAKCEQPSFYERRHRSRVSLSALVDRGRWFFPNIRREGRGADKLPAFQGYRHAVLHSLVAAYELVESLSYDQRAPNEGLGERLTNVKKAFVNEVLLVLDPRNREAEFATLIGVASGLKDSSSKREQKQVAWDKPPANAMEDNPEAFSDEPDAEDAESSPKVAGMQLRCRSKHAEAVGEWAEGGFLVRQGSTARMDMGVAGNSTSVFSRFFQNRGVFSGLLA